MKSDETTRQNENWFELMKLAHRCPPTVNGIAIVGPTRLTLWCLACHSDAETASTTVNSYTLTKEVGCSYDTLCRALQDLILAGLVSQSARFNRDSRTINRELLQMEVTAAAYMDDLGDLAKQDYARFYAPGPEMSDECPLDIQIGASASDFAEEPNNQPEVK
jgi:hypothetical protein